jgi:hypothetical protein
VVRKIGLSRNIIVGGVEMPISDFSGKTFVAFIDISGFKIMIKNNLAENVLDKFYNTGYSVLMDFQSFVDGIFVSDCGILFCREGTPIEKLTKLLSVIKKINEQMLQIDVMLTTSIAYDDFEYQERIKFTGIEKNLLFGNAYLKAYLDNENGKPKLEPGQCRIVKNDSLPSEIKDILENQNNHNNYQPGQDNIFEMIKLQRNKYYYYYWMRNNPDEISDFENQYKEATDSKYRYMLAALKNIALP